MIETLPTYRRTKEDLNKLSTIKPSASTVEPKEETSFEDSLTFNF